MMIMMKTTILAAYIQNPCGNDRVISPGQGGWRRYGFINADTDNCYNGDMQCSIYLNASLGYNITMRFQNMSLYCTPSGYSDYLHIIQENSESMKNVSILIVIR